VTCSTFFASQLAMLKLPAASVVSWLSPRTTVAFSIGLPV
jgi:hypothetical protein